jgi:predicted Ser/Thr protein kinase
VAGLRFFARGKRGVLYAGELKSNGEPVVAKLAADAASASSVTLEARWLRVMNRMGLGARLVAAGDGWFLCERLEGKNVVEFLAQDDAVATPANAKWVVREMLCQCFALDLMGVNKEEMTHPHRHIIVHRSTQRWRCTFVDFEKCASTKKPKNVTQLCQVSSPPSLSSHALTSAFLCLAVPELAADGGAAGRQARQSGRPQAAAVHQALQTERFGTDVRRHHARLRPLALNKPSSSAP